MQNKTKQKEITKKTKKEARPVTPSCNYNKCREIYTGRRCRSTSDCCVVVVVLSYRSSPAKDAAEEAALLLLSRAVVGARLLGDPVGKRPHLMRGVLDPFLGLVVPRVSVLLVTVNVNRYKGGGERMKAYPSHCVATRLFEPYSSVRILSKLYGIVAGTPSNSVSRIGYSSRVR